MGENGAGKSTLMKILSGVYSDYEGAIGIDGQTVRFASVRQAEAEGIAIIHQELNLVPELTVADNIFLGREPRIAGLFSIARRAATPPAHIAAGSASSSIRMRASARCGSANSNWWRSPRRCRCRPAS